jgi:hypothetical protein
VNADKIIPNGVERDHVHVVLELLGERIGEVREAAHLHTQKHPGMFCV